VEIDLIERKSTKTINTKLELLVFSGEEGTGAMVNEGRRVEQPSSWKHNKKKQKFILILLIVMTSHRKSVMIKSCWELADIALVIVAINRK